MRDAQAAGIAVAAADVLPKDDKFLGLAVAAGAAAIILRDRNVLTPEPLRTIEILEAEAFVNRHETR